VLLKEQSHVISFYINQKFISKVNNCNKNAFCILSLPMASGAVQI